MCFEKANNRKTNPKKLLKGRICIVGFYLLLSFGQKLALGSAMYRTWQQLKPSGEA